MAMTDAGLDLTVGSDEIAAARAGLIAAGRQLYARGDSVATSSNYSQRLSDGRIAITASGRDKGALVDADILLLQPDGSVIGGGRPSAETGLHLQLYRRLPSAMAVLHSHSRAVTVLTRYLAEASALTLTGYEMAKALPGITSHEQTVRIPIVANDQDIERLAGVIDALMATDGEPPAYLIRGHGCYVWGPDLATAHHRLEALEFLVACELDLLRLRAAKESS